MPRKKSAKASADEGAEEVTEQSDSALTANVEEEEEVDKSRLLMHQDSFNDEGPKISRERVLHIKSLLRKHLPRLIKVRSEQIAKDANYAKLCIQDAFAGRLKNGLATNFKKDKRVFKMFPITMFQIFSFQTNEILLKTVVWSSILHSILVFFEPSPDSYWAGPLFYVHLVISLIHVMDVLLKMAYEGFWMYWSHDWQRIYLITILSNFIDVLVNGRTTYTNFLRPVVGLLRARSGRRFFTIVQKMIPGLTQSLTPMFVFLLILIVISGICFDAEFPEVQDAQFASYNWFWMIYTNDTFDALLPEKLIMNFPYVVFFFTSIYLGQKFLLSLVLGATFDTFREFTKKQLKGERIKEMEGLVKAFAAVDVHKVGIISEPVFRALLSACNPHFTQEEKSLYYELASNGSPQGVTVLQFLNLREVLNYKFIRVRDSVALKYRENFQHFLDEYGPLIVVPVPGHLAETSKNILETISRYHFRDFINYVDLFLLTVGWLDLNIFGISACMLMSTYYVFEFQMFLIVNNGRLWELLKMEELFSPEFIVGTVGSIGMYTIPAAQLFSGNIRWKITLFFRFLRSMRIARMNEELSQFIHAMIDVMPLFTQSMTFAFVVCYIFAMMANLIFGKFIDRWSTPLSSMVAMNELFLPASFVDIMEEAMEKFHPLAMFYFMGYFILSMIIGNLSLSVIIEWYSENLNDKSKDARSNFTHANDELFKNIVTRATNRKVVGKNLQQTFGDIRYHKDVSNDHRKKIAEEDTIDLADLQKCQKQSNIDLTQYYNESHRHTKDPQKEVEFIRKVRGSGCCNTKKFYAGDTLICKGDPAENVILVTVGTISAEKFVDKDFVVPVSVQAVHAIGCEGLAPGGIYGMTYVADTDGQCLIFSQDDISLHMEPELTGTFIRLVFVSQAHMEELIAKKTRGKRRNRAGKVVLPQGLTSRAPTTRQSFLAGSFDLSSQPSIERHGSDINKE